MARDFVVKAVSRYVKRTFPTSDSKRVKKQEVDFSIQNTTCA
jgi:hypothetical protein